MNSLQLQISSSNADIKNDTQYIFYIPPNSIVAESQEQIFLSVQSAILPNSFYNINSNNNTLFYSLDSSPSIISAFALPFGNYTIYDMINYFNTNMVNFQVSYNKSTNKLLFENKSHINFTFYSSLIYNVIGFNKDITYHSLGGYLNSKNCINLATIQYINIKANFNTNNLVKYNINDKSIICSIPVSSNPTGIMSYFNYNNFKINTYRNQISEIILEFTDQNGYNINFNGVDWSIVLQLDIINFVD